MNRSKFGVQSNYSYGGRRRRYGFGKYVANKYRSSKAYSRRMNIRKNIKSGETTFKLMDALNIFPSSTAGNCYCFAGGTDNWSSLAIQIVQCTQWSSIAANWSLFKLTGISIRVAKIFNDNVGSMGSATLPSPPLYVNYFPSVKGIQYSGELIMSTDSALRVDPYVSGIQKKYISIPNNFSNLTNGIGLGTWNPVISIANLQGQISVGGELYGGTPVTTYPVFEMLVTYYVSVCNDKA
jgi:hypothetical protein